MDASVVATALGDDSADGRRARERISGDTLVAPEILDLEVASVWRRLCAAGRLDPDRADAALADLAALRLDRVPQRPLLARCWELRHNLTIYDAAYVALAEQLQATLLTADQHLADAPGYDCEVELLT